MDEEMSFKSLTITIAVSVFVIYTVLILSLFYFFSGSLFIETLFSERTLFSLRLSVLTATLATIVSLVFAIPSSYALSRYDFFGKRLIDTLLELPLIVSPVALGAMLLIFFNTPAGEMIQERSTQIVFTIYGILLAQFITTVGVAIRLMKAVLDEIPKKYEEMAWILGRSHWNTFFTVVLPLSKKGILSSAVLTWAKALGEFGATITIAGSMAMKTETLPVAIFMRLAGADIQGTVTLVLILIGIGLGILFGVRLLTDKA